MVQDFINIVAERDIKNMVSIKCIGWFSPLVAKAKIGESEI